MLQQTQGWRLRYWILMGYAVPVAALIVSAIVTYVNVRIARQNVSEVDRSAQINLELAQAEVGVQAMLIDAENFLVSQQVSQ